MTDHTDDPGATTPRDGDHDPMIADRFRVLERVTPPYPTSPGLAATVPGGPGESGPSGRRFGFVLAVAASVGVLMFGIVALVAATREDGVDSSDGAGDATDVAVAADNGAGSDPTAPLVVDGDAGVGTDEAGTHRSADEGSAGISESDDDTDADVPAATIATDTERSGTETDTEQSDDPNTTMAPAGADSAVGGDRPVSTSSTATTDVPPQTDDPGGETGGTTALRGLVTEVFTDCQSRLVLTETGEVVQTGPVSCDGGSYIVVDGTRVFTSSGFVSADLAFDKHPANLKPGVEVSVTATRTGGTSGPLSLACDTCRVRIL